VDQAPNHDEEVARRETLAFIRSERTRVQRELSLSRGTERQLRASVSILAATLTSMNEQTQWQAERMDVIEEGLNNLGNVMVEYLEQEEDDVE
jgi:hypothetical protein